MNNKAENPEEKNQVALASVLAAVFLTGSKIIIGLMTGSLGILSEALHSGLDMAAAVITYFSVRISGRPADADHHYGHGKVENFSALIETFLLLVTCVWIIHEAVSRLLTGNVHVEVNIWSYIVVITSILVDFTRSRALMKVAKKYNSQALEADALHFSTDIWSSVVVLIGLLCVNIGWTHADSVAALAVAVIVIYVSFSLGSRAVAALLDKAPGEMVRKIEEIALAVPGITSVHDIRVRNAGPDVFIELCIHMEPSLTIEQAHHLSDEVENCLHASIPRSSAHVHQEPEESPDCCRRKPS